MSYGTNAEAVVYGAVAQLEGIIDAKTATRLADNLIRQINAGDKISDHYIQAVTEAYRLGYDGPGIEEVRANADIASELTERQLNYAYNMGKKYAEDTKSARSNNGTKAADSGTKATDNGTKATKSRKPSHATGNITKVSPHSRGRVSSWGESMEQMQKSFNPAQKKAYNILRTIANVTGIDIVLFRSKADADGNFRGGIVNGINMDDAQGAFSWHDGKIYVDVNAGLTNESQVNDLAMYSMLRTFTHEFVHFIEQHNAAEYEAFRDLVFEEMREKGTDPEDLIDAYIMQHPEATEDEAIREVVAESMTDILPQTQFIQKLAEKKPGLFKKLLKRLKAFIQDIKDHFAHMGSTASAEVAAVKKDIDGVIRYTEKIVAAFDRVAVGAVENYQKSTPAQKNTAEGGVQYKLKKYSAKQLDNWSKSKRIVVYSNEEQLKEFINDSISDNTLNKKMYFGAIPADLAKRILSDTGIDVDNYNLSLGSYEVRKILKDHGSENKEALRGQRAVIPDDFAHIVEVVLNPDKIELSPDGYMGKPTIVFKGEHNGRMNVVAVVSDKRLDLFVQTVYVNVKKGNLATPTGDQAPVNTPEANNGTVSSTDRIRYLSENVNTNLSDSEYQKQRRTATLSNREILEQAAQSVGHQKLTTDQRAALDEFKGHLDELQKLEDRKAREQKIIQEAREKGAKQTEYQDAINRRNVLSSKIRRETETLLKLENTAVLRRVLQKAKGVIVDEQTAERNRALADYRAKTAESQQRTQLRNQIRRVVKDISKLYNKGKGPNNVKEEMKEFVYHAVSSAELLLDDLYTDDDMIRNGLGIKLGQKANNLLAQAKKILYRLDNPPTVNSVAQLEEWERREQKLKRNLSKIKSQLREEFLRERQYRKGDVMSMVMRDLCDAYEQLQFDKEPHIRNAFQTDVLLHLKGVRENLKSTRVEDMTLEELTDVYAAYTMVLESIRNANKAFSINGSIDHLAKQLINDFGGDVAEVDQGAIKNFARNASNAVGWNYEKLYYALERIGSPTFTQLFTNLANAENIIMEDVAHAKKHLLEAVNKYGFNKWKVNKKVDRVFVDNLGHSFKLTLGEVMLLYAYTRRGNVWKQLEIGGFTLGRKSLFDARNATAYKLTPEQCISITNTLTQEQKHFVEDMQKYLSEVMGEKGNEVSMKLHGVKRYNDPNYCPIHIAGEYKARADEAKARKEAGFESLSNAGFTKAKNPDATATIVLESFMDIWADHVNEMSRYHGAVPALEDIRRVMNYSENSDGSKDSKSVQAMLENKFGKQAVDYFRDLYREVNSGAVMDKLQAVPKKLLSKSRKAAVFYKLSVLIQQPSSICRAFAMVDKKYFSGPRGMGALPIGVAKTVTNRWTKAQSRAYEEMVKYAPGVTLAKEIGGFDAFGGGIRNYLMDTEKGLINSMKTGTAGEKLQAAGKLIDDNPIANLPNLADKIAWIEIWNACKRETKDKHRSMDVNSDAFMKLVGRRFTDVIRATQVYDSIFAKSPWLKSKNAAVQYLVSYMNEPNVTANMVESAIRDIRKGGGENIRKGAKKLFAVSRSIVFCAVLKSLVYAMHDDDEDETYIDKYTQAVISNAIDDITVFNYMPFVRDIWSACKGYDVERPDMSLFSDLIFSITKYYKIKNKDISGMSPEELEEWESQCTEADWGLIGAITNCFGIPVKNVYKEIDSVFNHIRISGENAGKTTWKTFADACYQGVVDALPFRDQESKSDKLYEALTEGNTKYLERIQAGYLNSEGKLKSSYYTALRKGLREHDPRIQEAAKARKGKDTDVYLDIIDEIVAEGHFTEKDVVAAIRSEYNQLKDEDSVKLLFEAMSSGDRKAAEQLKSNFVNDEGEFSESSYQSAIRKGLREYDPRILEAAEARLDKDHTTANKILNQIVQEGNFTRSDISAAITAEYNDLKDD